MHDNNTTELTALHDAEREILAIYTVSTGPATHNHYVMQVILHGKGRANWRKLPCCQILHFAQHTQGNRDV